MRLYIIRHGDPDYITDSLTDQGKVEAAVLAEHLAEVGMDEIYSSPLGRARETAGYTAKKLGQDVQVENWTQELWTLAKDGDRMSWDIHAHQIRSEDYLSNPHDWEHIQLLNTPEVRGLVNEVRENSDRFLAAQGYQRSNGVYRVSQANEKKLAIFCHGGFGLTWLSILLEIPTPLIWAGFFMHTTSVTTILFDEREPGIATPRCIGFGDLTHLHKKDILPSTSGIKANYY